MSHTFRSEAVFRPRTSRLGIALFCTMLGSPIVVSADPPPGYYDTVDTTDATTLRATLHAVIDDHTRFPYTSGSTDTWDILESASEDPNNPNNILDIYKNASYPKQGGGVGAYNREHSWPKSYGFPNDNSQNYPYTDCYQLFLCDSGYNGSRSNKPFRNCNSGCNEKPTDSNDGQGGGSGVYPGNSNWTSGSFTQGTWETWIGRRGDIARAQFYLDVRYEGGTHGITGAAEPDLILTDNEALIDASNTGSNESIAYMGMLSVLLQWHVEDPVDDWERQRTDIVSSFQGNRNPFVDHPEWVVCLFDDICGGGGDPPAAAPTGLIASAGDGVVDLNWSDNVEPDLDGYRVYRSTTAGGPYSQINVGLESSSMYSDAGVTNGTLYYYVVTAVDTVGQESGNSNEVNATPQPGGGGTPGTPWINEFHYDNSGGDTGEFVEIAGPAGTNLSGWQVVGYNGNGGGVYKTVTLSGTIPDQQGCMGTLAFAFSGMQNGAPDGLALVDASDTVVQFLSYEGLLTATDGVAVGMTSTDIGVSEQPAPEIGHSLQLSGFGSQYSDFAWQSPGPNTEGLPNSGQTLDGCGGDTVPPSQPTGLVAGPANAQVNLDWSNNVEPDLAGYNVHRSATPGGPYSQINGALVAASDFVDPAVTNCTTYFYVVTAVDTAGNESDDSNEDFATPDTDSDGDGTSDCNDGCPNDPNKTSPGLCGCGVPDSDSDNDGTPDCSDRCPSDPNKTEPGSCGCGVPETAADGDMNNDSFVDGRDIRRFVEALVGGPNTSDICHGDFDADTVLNMGDIPGMIDALLTQ